MAKIAYVQDKETGKYTSITVDGKKARPADLRGWNKASKTTFLVKYESNRVFANPFSGVEVELNPWRPASTLGAWLGILAINGVKCRQPYRCTMI
jgi:hypothetical protein